MRVEVWHNVLWSRYKGRVFSALDRLARANGEDFRFLHMAETEESRVGLQSVDLSVHKYPYELLYPGSTAQLRWYKTVPRYFWRALRNGADFVVIAGYSEPQNWAQLFGLMLRRTPRGVFCDSTLADQPSSHLRSLLKSFFFKHCDVVFCYGQRARELALKHGTRDEKIAVRCQAAAMPDDYDAARVPQLRVDRVSPTPCLLYVGRLAPEKNLDRLLQAFARYRIRRPAATLRLVGDGPLRAALQARAAELGIATWVVFTGGVDTRALADEYLAATCFLLPSLSEPWGLVVNEALSYGCPVVVSHLCGCVPELVDPEETGLSFDPYSVGSLVAALERMERDFADVSRVARDCLHRISLFSPDAAAEQIFHAVSAYFERTRK